MVQRAILTAEERRQRSERADQYWGNMEQQGENLRRAARRQEAVKQKQDGISPRTKDKEGQGIRV